MDLQYERGYKVITLLFCFLITKAAAAQAVAGMCGKAVISKRHYSSVLPALCFKAQGC